MKRFLLIAATVAVVILAATAVTYRLRFDRLPPDAISDHILMEKAARRLTLYNDDAVLKSYSVSLGRQPIGAKQFEGDGKTPEGHYVIDWRKADSSYHLALHISYPDSQDTQLAASQGQSPGGAIMIHGIRNGLGFLAPLHHVYDWTDGCIAVTDAEIEELWRAVPDGTPIEIRP